MTIYNFDTVTKEYLGSSQATVDPVEAGKFLIPGNSTPIVPPTAAANEVAVFNGETWELKANHRGTPIWNKVTKGRFVMQDLGEITAEYTTQEPPSPYHKWSTSGNKWVADTSRKQEIIQLLRARIDKATDAKILNDFEYQEHEFLLTLENQINYKTEYDLRAALTYPHRVKAKDEYFILNSAEEYASFALTAIGYVRTCLEAGWAEKDALNSKTTLELITILQGV